MTEFLSQPTGAYIIKTLSQKINSKNFRGKFPLLHSDYFYGSNIEKSIAALPKRICIK